MQLGQLNPVHCYVCALRKFEAKNDIMLSKWFVLSKYDQMYLQRSSSSNYAQSETSYFIYLMLYLSHWEPREIIVFRFQGPGWQLRWNVQGRYGRSFEPYVEHTGFYASFGLISPVSWVESRTTTYPTAPWITPASLLQNETILRQQAIHGA